MRHPALLLLPAALCLAAQDDLSAQLTRVQGLGSDTLRDLQARLALSGAPEAARVYHEAHVTYALVNQRRGADTKAAEAQVERALKALGGRKDADALALQGALVTQKMSFSPASAMTLAPRASGLYEAALKAEPANPRALLLHGIYVLHTPAFFGGGAERALPLLEGAVKAATAEASTPAPDPWAPRWGRIEALAWLAIAQAQARQGAEAEATLAAARNLDPTHGLLRYATSRVASVKAKG